ncbi:MAG: hypothetical protein WBC73_09965 [Phormidesmis sp.]
MKPTILAPQQPLTGGQLLAAGPQTLPVGPAPVETPPGESIRHILLGRPAAVRQTIHLLHSLRYAETVLWTPVLAIETPLVITPVPGESLSLLRRMV